MSVTHPFVGAVTEPAVHLMTLNVRRQLPRFWPGRRDRWSNRRAALRQLVDQERPTILGLQEVMPRQSSDIRALLGGRYDSVGSGRDAHRGGERVELHVDTERFRILKSRTRWLSRTPTVPGSRSFGNAFPRIVLHAELRGWDGVRWLVLVTHFDHVSERSRRASAGALLDSIRYFDGPVVVLGDFNTDAHSATHRLLTESGSIVDTFDLALRRPDPDWGSFSRYRPPTVGARRLDWILVGPGITVETAGVNPARFAGTAASDHDPVQAVVHREETALERGASGR